LVKKEGAQRILDDLFGRYIEGFLDGKLGGGIPPGGIAKAGFDGSGTNGKDADTVAPKLEAKCFAEARNVSFCCRINGEVGNRKNAGERTEIKNRAPLGNEAWEEDVGEMGQGLHIEADHLLGLIPIGSTKLPVVAHAGVVEQAVGVKVLAREGVDEVVATGRAGKIAGDDFDAEGRVGLNKFFGEFLQKRFAPGDENKGLDAGRELNGILPSESGAGTGNEGAVNFRIRNRHVLRGD
jgi:hypothetical protein